MWDVQKLLKVVHEAPNVLVLFLILMKISRMHIILRCNFGVMMLTEIVSDRPEVQWIINLPLMLHVSFLGENYHHHFIRCFGKSCFFYLHAQYFF